MLFFFLKLEVVNCRRLSQSVLICLNLSQFVVIYLKILKIVINRKKSLFIFFCRFLSMINCDELRQTATNYDNLRRSKDNLRRNVEFHFNSHYCLSGPYFTTSFFKFIFSKLISYLLCIRIHECYILIERARSLLKLCIQIMMT